MAQAGSIDTSQSVAQLPEVEELTATKPPESDGQASDSTASKTQEDVFAITHELTSHVLQFLSNASNETLGACLVGLGAITYMVLGRVGLVLIGVIGGVVLHATWEENNQNQTNETSRALEVTKKRERGLDVIERILDWRERRSEGALENSHLQGQDSKHSLSSEEDFSGFQPAVRTALASLTDAVIRDYVKWWYSPLLPLDVSFPSSCRQMFTRFLLAISSHLSRKRPADAFLDFVTNSSSIIIVFLNELSAAFMSSGSSNVDPSTVIYKYLEANPSCSLANVLDVEQQTKRLQAESEGILRTFLDSNAYKCDPVKLFLREVLAGLVLETTVQSCSKPEWINSWIIYLLEEKEPELLNAIDAGVGGATASVNIENTSQSAHASGISHLNESFGGSLSERAGQSEHKRNMSRAESAMEEAMQEAKRLSELIAAEEAKKEHSQDESASSGAPTLGELTPTSSQSGFDRSINKSPTESTEEVSIESQTTTSDTLQSNASRSHSAQVSPMTLFKAKITNLGEYSEENAIKRALSAPRYHLKIQPSNHPCWFNTRRYADFKTLHDKLLPISRYYGLDFAANHENLPNSKNSKNWMKEADRYLNDALEHEELAEIECMKRFLEKEQGIGPPRGAAGDEKQSPEIGRNSQESAQHSLSAPTKSTQRLSLSSRPSLNISEPRDGSGSPLNKTATQPEFDEIGSQNGTVKPSPLQLPQNNENKLQLPPLPSEIPDDYKISQVSPMIPSSSVNYSTARSSTSSPPASDQSPSRQSISSLMRPPEALLPPLSPPKREKPLPVSEEEARMAMELFFAVINELYALSSAWNIRRTLLNAAKGFLLRPGNPNLEAIRLLLQDTIIEANTSETGLAAHLTKLRENTLPTEEERKSWPPPPTQEEKERLRVKARKLLVERGMPQALTSVMGAAASGVALGRVFDCLQVEEVARGLMCTLVLRGVGAIMQ
ncbi:hypothetical protein MMC07_007394 [Pseudocyphellaria aurata]|nr:hypothetical protein [Pseudocyphellaria aurata]